MHRSERGRLSLLPIAMGCISCSHAESSDTIRLLEPQAQAATPLAAITAPPSDLYPIISPLVGGNSYAIAHPNDYDIARDPNEVPPTPLANDARVTFNVLEVNSVIAPADPTTNPPVWSGAADIRANFLAFGATTEDPSVPSGFWSPRVPAPFLKVTAGNTVNVVLQNSSTNTNTHSIDFHAVVGLKGGSAMLTAAPGATATLAITPTHPGLYLYHCSEAGTPRGIAEHMNMGMYGMMLVLGSNGGSFGGVLGGASEHYVFEEDVFLDSSGNFDEVQMLNTLTPDFVTYNGRVASLIDHPLTGSSTTRGTSAIRLPSRFAAFRPWRSLRRVSR
jgi:FtsP/CotA-like multicopper oxidase with cupredoxin domain